MKNQLIIILCAISFSAFAQNKRAYNNALKSAFHIHDTASVYASSGYAAEILEKAAADYPNEWLASYWAAFIYTQMGLYPDRPENAGEILPKNALKNMEIAKSRYKGDSSQVISDLHALEGFIYQVHLWYPEYKNEKDMYIEKAKEHSKLALRYNPDNPLVFVLIGTQMVRSDKLSEVVAGRALLKQANILFKQVDEHPAITTQWNQNWLRFRWSKFADDQLTKLTKE